MNRLVLDEPYAKTRDSTTAIRQERRRRYLARGMGNEKRAPSAECLAMASCASSKSRFSWCGVDVVWFGMSRMGRVHVVICSVGVWVGLFLQYTQEPLAPPPGASFPEEIRIRCASSRSLFSPRGPQRSRSRLLGRGPQRSGQSVSMIVSRTMSESCWSVLVFSLGRRGAGVRRTRRWNFSMKSQRSDSERWLFMEKF